jgi:predicted ATPase
LDAAAASPFVGREQELASLQEGWRRARAGKGSLVLISGEAGVGKTRLVEALADQLHWQGARVVWGRCYEFARGLPYEPVAEALRAIVATLTSDQLARFPVWTVREVARLVPALSDRVALPPSDSPRDGAAELSGADRGRTRRAEGGAVPPTPFDLGREQAGFFDGLACFLAQSSSSQPLLIVLEDLHWA